jgi:hypothetical protein
MYFLLAKRRSLVVVRWMIGIEFFVPKKLPKAAQNLPKKLESILHKAVFGIQFG